MSSKPLSIEVIYDSFHIPVQLADYQALTLSDEERAKAKKEAASAPAEQEATTNEYLLQAAFVEKITSASTMRVPKQLIHERALAMGRALQQKLEMDQLTLEGYLAAMKTTKDTLITDFEIKAKQQLRQRIVLLAIASNEGLEASDADYAQEIARLSNVYGMPEEELVGFFAASGENESIRQDITVSKAAELVRKLATV